MADGKKVLRVELERIWNSYFLISPDGDLLVKL